jgi:hypothetical protein
MSYYLIKALVFGDTLYFLKHSYILFFEKNDCKNNVLNLDNVIMY